MVQATVGMQMCPPGHPDVARGLLRGAPKQMALQLRASPAAQGCRGRRFPGTGSSASTEPPLPSPPVAMDLRAELLKSIWYAFTALDVEKSGKVSKSQLKVSP